MAAYLQELDLTGWDAKAPPPKTPAWWAMVDANRAPEDAELGDLLEEMGYPAALTKQDLVDKSADSLDFGTIRDWLSDNNNVRAIPHRMDTAGYAPVRNDGDKRDGLWKVRGRKVAIYVKKELSLADQLTAAKKLMAERRKPGEGGESGVPGTVPRKDGGVSGR